MIKTWEAETADLNVFNTLFCKHLLKKERKTDANKIVLRQFYAQMFLAISNYILIKPPRNGSPKGHIIRYEKNVTLLLTNARQILANHIWRVFYTKNPSEERL